MARYSKKRSKKYVVEKFVRQLKNSVYSQKVAKENVVNGIIGWKRMIKEREREGKELYRPAQSTLRSRVYKKLMEKESWYKEKKKDLDETEDEEIRVEEREDTGNRKRKWNKDKEKGKIERKRLEKEKPVEAAMVVPYTHASNVAKELRQAEFTMAEMYGHRLKKVQKAGLKLEDAVKTNAWKGQPCDKQRCLLCETKVYTGKNLGQSCSKSNLVYQTHCITCEEKEIARTGKEAKGNQKNGKRKK